MNSDLQLGFIVPRRLGKFKASILVAIKISAECQYPVGIVGYECTPSRVRSILCQMGITMPEVFVTYEHSPQIQWIGELSLARWEQLIKACESN